MSISNTIKNYLGTSGVSVILLGVVCAALAGHFAWHQFAIPPEAALRLSEAQLIDGGATAYVDFYDTATPFYLYLNLVPVWLARVTSCHPILLFNELNVLLLSIGGGLLVMLSQLHRGPGPRATAAAAAVNTGANAFSLRRNFLTANLTPFLAAYLLIVVLRVADFGHSNQLLFVAATPYIVSRALRRRGVRLPRPLSFIIAFMLALAVLTDLLYLFGFVLFEALNLLSFTPFPRRRFVARRFFSDELILAVALIVCALFGWWLTPLAGQTQYLTEMMPLYFAGFAEIFGPLRYNGNGSDLRPDIFLAVFLLVLAAPFAARNILSRMFALASLLAFALMIAWTACFYYQSFGLVAFALLALTACLKKLPGQARFMPSAPGFISAVIVLNMVAATATYLIERAATDQRHVYGLAKLGYWGQADSHDLGPMSEAIETSSQPKEKVGVVTIGIRPAYPSITQLRRLPGLSLTWGFPIMTLNLLNSPVHQDEALKFAPLKQKIFSRMAAELSDPVRAPKMVAIEAGDTSVFLEQTNVLKAVDKFYTETATVPLFDLSESNEHQLKEFIGYKNCVSVFVRKN